MSSRLHVLIVDDEPMMAEIAAQVLEAFGAAVDVATSGEEALHRLRQESFDVVLLDIMMPGMDGREVCRRIKTDEAMKDVSVVMHSSLTESEIEWESCGADGFRRKSYDLPGLAGYLEALVS